ncbi:MAG: hypothetical protein AAGI52_17505 [Bacteroidota bacterium]
MRYLLLLTAAFLSTGSFAQTPIASPVTQTWASGTLGVGTDGVASVGVLSHRRGSWVGSVRGVQFVQPGDPLRAFVAAGLGGDPSQFQGRLGAGEVGVTLGRVLVDHPSGVSRRASAGGSVVGDDEGLSLGFPVGLSLTLGSGRYGAVGVDAIASLNSRRPFAGAGLTLALGRLR